MVPGASISVKSSLTELAARRKRAEKPRIAKLALVGSTTSKVLTSSSRVWCGRLEALLTGEAELGGPED
jgi:hypothetical protein